MARFVMPIEQVVNDDASSVGANWKLNFYLTGTTTRKDTFSDSALTTANANPVVADSAGRFGDIFLESGTYKVVLTDADAVEKWTADPVDGAAGSSGAIDAKTGAYTVTVADATKIIDVDATSGTVTITLLPVATAGNGFEVSVRKSDSGANAVTVDADGAETINGSATHTLSDQYAIATYRCDGSAWIISRIGKLSGDTTPKLAAPLNTNSQAINLSEGSAVASATQPNIWATDGNTIHMTGTTQVDDFTDAPRIGASRWIIFDGVLAFTHGSGITQPGGATITTAAGDMAYVYADAVDAFRVAYFPIDGLPVITALPTADFTSTEQTVTANTLLDVAHGLGAIPTLFIVVLRCKTTQHGYSVDDAVFSMHSTDQGSDAGVTIAADATNITLSQGNQIYVIGQSTFNAEIITVGNFKWIVRAWT